MSQAKHVVDGLVLWKLGQVRYRYAIGFHNGHTTRALVRINAMALEIQLLLGYDCSCREITRHLPSRLPNHKYPEKICTTDTQIARWWRR